MNNVLLSKDTEIATVRLERGRVNAINEDVVRQIRDTFVGLAADEGIKSIILTGSGRFFSFGFDIPEFLSYDKSAFLSYLESFCSLYAYLFQFPKPIVAALNGHTVAGGCMLATACDYRIMVDGKAKISLNEISFGSSVFAGSVEMLRCCVGTRNAHKVLFSGKMLSSEEAREIGLIDERVSAEDLNPRAMEKAREFAHLDLAAFWSIKKLLRAPFIERMELRESDSLKEFVDIWYSESTWKKLQSIRIN